jgi:hypothetical protein
MSNFKSEHIVDYLSTKLISNEKNLNYKVVDLDKSYNCRTNFISIQIHMRAMIFNMCCRKFCHFLSII